MSPLKKETSEAWNLLYQLCQLALSVDVELTSSIPIPSKKVNWALLFQLAHYHKVSLLLHTGINLWTHKDLVPPAFKQALKKKKFQIARQNLFQSKSLLQILSLFQEHKIKVIPYKGIVLSKKIYGDIGMRRSSDLDLLIAFSDFEKVKKLLLEEGFKENFVLPGQFEKDRIKYGCEYGFILQKPNQPKVSIDLHWSVGDKIQQLNLSYHDFSPFIQKDKLFGVTADFFSPEGLFLSTSIHHSKEQWRSLSYITDITGLLLAHHKTFDWDKLVKVAQQKKIENILYLSLGMAQSFIAFPMPTMLHQKLKQQKIQYYLQKFLLDLPFQSSQKVSPNQLSLEKMKNQFFLRKKISTKLKIMYYNFIQILLPNGRDIEAMEAHEISYWKIFFTKPFRLWKEVNLTKHS